MNKFETKFTKKDIMKNFIMNETGCWNHAWIIVYDVDRYTARIHNVGLSSTIEISNKFIKGTFIKRN